MNTTTEHPFTTAELLSFLMEVQADRISLMTESCHSESEAKSFNDKVEAMRKIILNANAA